MLIDDARPGTRGGAGRLQGSLVMIGNIPRSRGLGAVWSLLTYHRRAMVFVQRALSAVRLLAMI